MEYRCDNLTKDKPYWLDCVHNSRSTFWPIEHMWTNTNRRCYGTGTMAIVPRPILNSREKTWSHSNIPLLLSQHNYIHSWLSMDPHSQNTKVVTAKFEWGQSLAKMTRCVYAHIIQNVHLHTQETTHSTTLRYPNVS